MMARFELIFADKKSNSSGLQFADLIARPVGLSVLKPTQENRAFDALRPKFYSHVNGWGLKCLPPRKQKASVFHRGLMPTGNPQSVYKVCVDT